MQRHWKERDKSFEAGLPRTQWVSEHRREHHIFFLLPLYYASLFKFLGGHPSSQNRNCFGTGQSYCSTGGEQVKQQVAWVQLPGQSMKHSGKKGGTFHFCIGPKPLKWECFPSHFCTEELETFFCTWCRRKLNFWPFPSLLGDNVFEHHHLSCF